MFSVPALLKLAPPAIGGAILAVTVYSILNSLWWLPAARNEGALVERAEQAAATDRAIGELSNEADRSRFNRRLCLERGGLYLHATGKCAEREDPAGR